MPDVSSYTHGRILCPKKDTAELGPLVFSLRNSDINVAKKEKTTIIKTSNPIEIVLPCAAVSENRDLALP